MLKNFTTEGNRSLDYLVANLLDFFRDPKAEYRFLEAAKIAQNQFSRMASLKASVFEKRYLFFASKLKNNVSPTSLRAFAEECFDAALTAGLSVDKKLPNNLENTRSLHKKARQELFGSLACGYSVESAVGRAAYELIKIKRETDKLTRLHKLASMHPLKETLEVLNVGSSRLAKEDIKNQFLHLNKKAKTNHHGTGVLYHLLERAQAFSTRRLHQLLGDELFFLCRPLGFFDQESTIVIVEVPTSAHLHALTYRKLDIMRSLKKDLAFSKIKNLRFKINNIAL